jgi:site-specific DNA recombinase
MSKDKSDELIPAVGYLRKSTKGRRKDKDGEYQECQEKSIPAQKESILHRARGRYEIRGWFVDDGVPGWKKGAARPDFQRMKDSAASLGARAVLVDDIDRFSRANQDDIQEDARELRKAGVRWVDAVSHTAFDLEAGQRNDIGGMIGFVAAAWAAHESSRKLARRIARTRRNAAMKNKRSGGYAPYGLVDDDDNKGWLKAGEPDKVAIVRWMFDLIDPLGDERRHPTWLATDLNRRKVPGPKGGVWYVSTVIDLLRRPEYKGTFRFNLKHSGHFYGINADGEIVDALDLAGTGKLYSADAVWEPLIDPDQFDRVQTRLDELAKDRSRSRREGNYVLSGVLVCGHCGRTLDGVRSPRPSGKRSPTVYRCKAMGLCRPYQIPEAEILPFVLRLLGEEIANIRTLLSSPPDSLFNPGREAALEWERKKAVRDQLKARIDKAEDGILDEEDPRTRKSLSAKVSAWRDELETLDAELSDEPKLDGQRTRSQLEALAAWWDEFEAEAVWMPVRDDQQLRRFGFDPDAMDPDKRAKCEELLYDSHVEVSPRRVNEALKELGCEVRLWWRLEARTSMLYKVRGVQKGGQLRERPIFDRGEFRLGQRRGTFKGKVTACPASRT